MYILLHILKKKLDENNFESKKVKKYIFKKIIIMAIVMIYMFGIIRNTEKTITDIYEKDKNNEKNTYIISITDKKEGKNKTTYTVIFKNISGEKRIRINGKVSLKKKLELGKDYILKGKLEKYSNERNYMGFNPRLYMYSKSNYFKIIEHEEKIEEYIRKEEKINVHDIYNECSKQILVNISKYRIVHRQILEKYVKNKYLLEGIIVGDIDNVDEDTKERFKDINSYHLLAISGSHMAYLMMIIEFVVRKIKAGKMTTNILSIAIIGMYIILAGFSPAVLRAGISSIILACLRIKNIKTSFRILYIIIHGVTFLNISIYGNRCTEYTYL